jgi:hypothetical protein
MEKRGYPVVEFERRAADLSIDHAAVVTNYRRAHNLSRASDRNNATSEDMREAMHNYGALVDDLLRAD